MFTVENLAVRLGDKNILQNVHFTIDTPGQLVGILGANGSGKTTLLRAVAGLLPHTGCCLMDGVPLESLSTRCLAQTVSYIPQQSGISVSMSAREVVLMGCNPRLGVLQSPTAAMCAAAEEALRTVGLADKAEQDYLTLSGGERQLCILARTFVEDAPLLLLDEPDSALDLANRSHMAALLAEFVHASGKTALICLHDPMLMLDWCDTLIVLQNGQVGAMLYPRTDPVEALQSALAAVYGPLELVRTGFRAVVFTGDGPARPLTEALVTRIAELGGRVVTIGTAPAAASDAVLPLALPQVAPGLLALIEMLPIQYLVIPLAIARGFEPAAFLNAQKITTGE